MYNGITFQQQYLKNEMKQIFKSSILCVEYSADTAAILLEVIFPILFYNKDTLLIKFGDDAISYLIKLGLIQLIANLITHTITTFIDVKYNKINLKYSWTQRTCWQKFSEIVIFIWIGKDIIYVHRLIPNFINCKDYWQICSCSFSNSNYGC